MSGRANVRTTRIRLLMLLLASGLVGPAARAGILVPQWSLPLDAAVVSAAVGASTYNTERLFLLLADGRVLTVAATDSLRLLGHAPGSASALASLPTAPRGASDIAVLIAFRSARACELEAWNRNGQRLWRAAVPGMTAIDSIFFVAESHNQMEFCAWQQGEPWLVNISKQLWDYSASAARLRPGFAPSDALACDFDRDGSAELVFFDGAQLAVYHLHQGLELRCQWQEPDSLSAVSANRAARPRIACATYDSTPVLLVATPDTLRYVDAMTGEETRLLFSGPESSLPGPADAVVAQGATAYATGVDSLGRIYLAGLAADGPARVRLLSKGARTRVLALLKDWPLLLVGDRYGEEDLLAYAPGLAGTSDNAPGYSNTRLLRVIQLRVDEDTFPDLAVLRTAGDARWRVDVFANGTGLLAENLRQARQALLRAVLGQSDDAVRRAVHRVEELERETGAGGVGQERPVLDRFRASMRLRNTLAAAGAIIAALLTAIAGWLLATRRRRAARSQQIEQQPVASRVALAADLIALDHNFMSKGNRPAGFERLIEIRNQHGLERDRDLGRSGRVSSQQLTGVYAGAITRLIDASPTLPLLEFIQTTIRNSPRGGEFESLELTAEELRRLDRAPGVRLVTVANHECPDYLNRFRIFSNPVVRGTLEHIILDHVRHAARWAHVIASYTVNTQWNRRLLLSFRSDSPNVVPFNDPRAHITSQLRELGTMLRPAIDLPRDGSALVGPLERLWISFADYIAVLEETRTRVSAP